MVHANDLFNVPSGETVKVSIIDSTLRLNNLAAKYLMTPALEGFDMMPTIPTWSFVIEHSSGKKALFDLGVPPDWEKFAPVVVNRLKKVGWDIKAEKNVAEILEDHGIDRSVIGSVIWSHWHWDHIGDPSTFPGTTDLVVGPGFKEAFLPGYPAKDDSPVRASDWEGRNLREINFDTESNGLKAGKFRAFDFFGDGSFYLLDTPGHAVGHLAGLARTTTNPDTFIFMGGDLCHHGGEIRPSQYLPLPATFDLNAVAHLAAAYKNACPGGVLFEELNTKRGRNLNQTFFDPCTGLDIPLAIKTISETQEADVNENVWFVFAHDNTLHGVVEQFPLPANDWKKKGWGEKTKWAFLKDFVGAVGGKNKI